MKPSSRFVSLHLNLSVLITAIQQPKETGEAPRHLDPRKKTKKCAGCRLELRAKAQLSSGLSILLQQVIDKLIQLRPVVQARARL